MNEYSDFKFLLALIVFLRLRRLLLKLQIRIASVTGYAAKVRPRRPIGQNFSKSFIRKSDVAWTRPNFRNRV